MVRKDGRMLGLSPISLNSQFQFQPSVVLVTRAMRGYWLVQALLKKGWKVTVLNWPLSVGQVLSDIDGPFPLFAGPEVSDDMIETFSMITPVNREKESHFQIWLEDGPLEFAGALGKHQMKQRGIVKSVIDEIVDGQSVDPKSNREPFTRIWPHLFARQAASLEDIRQIDAFDTGRAMSLGRKIYLRDMAAERETEMWTRLKGESQDFEYIPFNPSSSALKISGSGRSVDYLKFNEIDCEVHGYIWALSSEETLRLIDQRSGWVDLFSSTHAAFEKAEKVWIGFTFQLEAEESILDGLPDWFVVSEDIALLWNDENMIVIRKNQIRPGWTAWMRLPVDTINNTNREESYWERCQTLLSARIPEAKIKRITSAKSRVGLRVEPKSRRGEEIVGRNFILIGPDRWLNWSLEEAYIWEGKAIQHLERFHTNWRGQADREFQSEQRRLQKEEYQRQRQKEKSLR